MGYSLLAKSGWLRQALIVKSEASVSTVLGFSGLKIVRIGPIVNRRLISLNAPCSYGP